ncbi:hypothetical protein AAIH46_04540 [Rhizobium sp. 0TCS1.26]|uniref:hypothetical protein n=1 Tax=Rhizobium sp. 0TCS1.26 TaxID=3142623 RepID=UPI003D2A1454
MLSDIAAWFITIFVLNPVQAEVQTHLERVNATSETVQQARECISTHAPKLIQRAGAEPVWAVVTAVGMTIGWTSPASLLDRNDPNCAPIAGLLEDGERQEQGS